MDRGEHGIQAVARSSNAHRASRIDKCGKDEAQQLVATIRRDDLVGQKPMTTGLR